MLSRTSNPLGKNVYYKKQEFFSNGEQVQSFQSKPPFQNEGYGNIAELSPL